MKTMAAEAAATAADRKMCCMPPGAGVGLEAGAVLLASFVGLPGSSSVRGCGSGNSRASNGGWGRADNPPRQRQQVHSFIGNNNQTAAGTWLQLPLWGAVRKAATATATSPAHCRRCWQQLQFLLRICNAIQLICAANKYYNDHNRNNSLKPQAFNAVDFNIWLTPFDLIVVARYRNAGSFRVHVGKVNFNRADFDKGRKLRFSSSSIWHCSNSFIRIEDLQYLLLVTLLTQNTSDKEFNRFGLLASRQQQHRVAHSILNKYVWCNDNHFLSLCI